jgi:hypothetical protein
MYERYESPRYPEEIEAERDEHAWMPARAAAEVGGPAQPRWATSGTWSEQPGEQRAAPRRAAAAARRVRSRYYGESLLDRLAPAWGKRAAESVKDIRSPGYRTLVAIVTLIVCLLGVALLFGGAYTSIQGLKYPLAAMGLPVITAGFPALQWWLWPVGLTIVQIGGKRIDGFRSIWWTAYVFDGATTGVFFSAAVTNLIQTLQRTGRLGSLEPTQSVVIIGGISALVGLCVAIFAEQILLASLAILRGLKNQRA